MAQLRPGLSPLLTDETLEKLKPLGIKTVVDFISEPAPQLSKRAGLSCEDVLSIRRSLLFQYGSYPVSARELWEEEWITRGVVISMGCPCLDEILGGGLICGQLTELCGPPASGKTQICLAVAGGVAMTTKSSVMYIDSGSDFSSTRLSQMLVAKGLNNEQVARLLQRIRIFQVTDIFELLSLLGAIRKNIAEEIDHFHSNVRVVIIDAITFFISPLLGGRQFHGHALMSQVSMAMKELAYQHSIAFLYSNNVVVDFGSSTVGGVKPALGRTWTYVPSTRIMLSQQGSDSITVRLATIIKSSRQPIGAETKFLIRECGLESFASTRQLQ